MDRLQAMKTFVRVVEAGSFSAVARETGATQSAISKQVAALEATLGAPLLTRTTRSLAMTDEGQAYFERAQRILEDVEDAESAVHDAAHRLSGQLRVAASVGFGRIVLLPLVQRFLAQHPLVTVDLRLSDAFVDLTEQGIDVAIRLGALADSSLIARRVSNAPRRVVAHRALVKKHGLAKLTDPEQLRAHPCVLYSGLTTGREWRFVAGPDASAPEGTERAVRVQGALQTNSSEAVRAAVIAGMGIGYVPEWLVRDELESGALQVLLPAWAPPAVAMHVVMPPARRPSAKVQAFAAFVAEALADPRKRARAKAR